MFSSTQAVSFGYLRCHRVSHAARSCCASEIAARVKPAQLLQTVVVGLAWQVIEAIAQEMHVAALPGGFGQDLGDCLA